MCKRKSDIESSGEKECIQPMETIKEGTTMHYESPGGSLWIWDSRLKKRDSKFIIFIFLSNH